MRAMLDLTANVFDIGVVIKAAFTTLKVRLHNFAEHSFTTVSIAFNTASSLAVLTVQDTNKPRRRPSKITPGKKVAPSWLFVQPHAKTLIVHQHMVDFSSRVWSTSCRAMCEGAIMAGCFGLDIAGEKVRNAGLKLHRVGIVGRHAHCDATNSNTAAAPSPNSSHRELLHSVWRYLGLACPRRLLALTMLGQTRAKNGRTSRTRFLGMGRLT
jgi:hypothetical protein